MESTQTKQAIYQEEQAADSILFKPTILQNFENFQQLLNSQYDISAEKIQENFDQTLDEIESLQQTFNQQEIQIIKLDEIDNYGYLKNLDKKFLQQVKINFLLNISIVPKFDDSLIKFAFIDKVMKNKVVINALPSIELIVALPESYPSHQRPLFLQRTKFYSDYGDYDEFLTEQINEKWSEEMPVLFNFAIYFQGEFMEQYIELKGIPKNSEKLKGTNLVVVEFPDLFTAQSYIELSQKAYRRQFDEEQHNCLICARDQLGEKFFFMSGCEHSFCKECVQNMVIQKINDGQISQLTCAQSTCKKMFNDKDIKNLNLDEQLQKKYEKLSLDNAISQMDDMGWCPLPSCSQIANFDKEQNIGTCTFCDFKFCLDCKDRTHPFKRCPINRLDLMQGLQGEEKEKVDFIMKKNDNSAEILNKLFLKHCTKSCPNPKCGVPIIKIESGCSQIQCPKCYNYFCWTCNNPAKGQKHYKEKPDHESDKGTLLPYEVTHEIIVKYCNEDIKWINLKFCAMCPCCKEINEKKNEFNTLRCTGCDKKFCYICNKEIVDDQHYQGKRTCREVSDLYSDI